MAEAPRYYRVSPKFWSDPVVISWDDDTRLLALYVLTCEHRTVEGLFRLPKQYILADLEWSAERLAEPFGQLIADGFLDYDEAAKVMLIRKALAYQSPGNPNGVTSALRALEMVPPTRLDFAFYELARRYSERLAEGLPQRFTEPLAEPPTPPPAPPPTPTPPGGNGEPFVKRLADELRSDHDCKFQARENLHDAYADLLKAALARLPDDRHRPTAMGVIADFVHAAQGLSMTKEARSHTARLVNTHDPLDVLYGYGQALDWGAGIGERYADDALALSKYVAGVLGKRGKVAS